MPSPVTHITGYLYGLELPFAAGLTVVLMDRWTASEEVELMERHAVTFTVGATPFLVELVGSWSDAEWDCRRCADTAAAALPSLPK